MTAPRTHARTGARARALALATALGAALTPGAPARGDAPLLAHGDRLLALPPRRPARAPSDRLRLAAPLPAQPWARPAQRVPLGGATTAPLALDARTVVLGLSSPPSIAWVDLADGRVRASASLDDRPAMNAELAAGADGRVFVVGDNRVLYTVAPDGSVRGAHLLVNLPMRGPIVRDDGSVAVVAAASGTTSELTALTPAGELVATRSLPGRLLAPPYTARDGTLWLLLSTGVASLAPAGGFAEAAFGRNATQLVPLDGDAVAVVTGSELQIRAARGGALRGHLEVGTAPPTFLAPLPGGGLALAVAGPPQELWLITRESTVAARVPLASGSLQGLLVDPAGALLAVLSSGELLAIEPDGAVRWTLALRDGIARPPAPVPGGGVAVALASGTLVVLR